METEYTEDSWKTEELAVLDPVQENGGIAPLQRLLVLVRATWQDCI